MRNVHLFILFSVLTCIFMAGCVHKQYDLSSIEGYFESHKSNLKEIASAAKKNLSEERPYIGYDYDEFVLYSKEQDGPVTLNEKDKIFGTLIQLLKKEERCIGVEVQGDMVVILLDNNDFILFDDKATDKIQNPFQSSIKGPWEKKVANNQVTFISDHRKEKETEWRGMYYQVDVKIVEEGVFACHLTTRYPWYSNLIG